MPYKHMKPFYHRISDTVRSLCLGNDPIQKRLRKAFTYKMLLLANQEIPSEIKTEWEYLLNELTNTDKITEDKEAYKISDQETVNYIEKILDLYEKTIELGI